MDPSAVYVAKPTPCKPKAGAITTGSEGLFRGINVVPLKACRRGSYLPGPQLLKVALSVTAGERAMMAPTFSVVFGQPSRRLPIPGATELSTVEWHSAQVTPTVRSEEHTSELQSPLHLG